jgi:UDP-N-acetylmuramoyl-tripeptide--D-alanyl-D-alanine ligase
MGEALWTASEIAAATGGRDAIGGSPGAFTAHGVSIDTRTLQPGDLFVALGGVRDGHAFIEEAVAKGAAGVLASRPTSAPAVEVKDVFEGLKALGLAARDRAPDARRCAVTGSVGKTSVTQAIAAALKAAGPSHNSVLSYNNHIGVPLTLARMPRQTLRAVFEIGMNHADEIRPLVKMVRPHVAVVTTVGAAHVENFPDGEAGVARAKAEIFEGLEPGGVAILNADDRWFDLLKAAAQAQGAKVTTFGARADADARLVSFEPDEASGAIVVATVDGQTLRFPIAQNGAHWGPNSLATLLAVKALGAPIDVALEALARFAPLAGRGETHRLAVDGGDVLLIDESYNANPISMRAALASLGASLGARQGRRIAVLTDMLEMGEESLAMHAALAEPIAAAGVDLAFLAGPAMRGLWDALPQAVRGAWRETAGDLVPEVRLALRPGDVVMAKGSNGSKASLVVQSLLDASLKDAPALAGKGR